MAGFQPGEEISWPFVVLDEDGQVIDLAGGMLTAEVWWRGVPRLTLSVGSGLVILDPSPDQAEPGENQSPHGIATVSELQSAPFPVGRIVKVRTIFVDTLDRTFIGEFQYLTDVLNADLAQVRLGGRQGPAGPAGDLDTIGAAPVVDIAANQKLVVFMPDGSFALWTPYSMGFREFAANEFDGDFA